MNGPTFATRAPAQVSPPAPSRPAPPRHPARPAAAVESEGPVSMHRLVVWLKLYWMMVLFCGSLLGAVMAYAAWTLLPSKFESYAQLRVASAPFTVTDSRDPNRNRTDFNTYLKTNAKLIRSEFVLTKALGMEIDGKRISELATIKAQPNPIAYLEEELQIAHTEGVEIITLSLKGAIPGDVQRILNAVQKAFMDEVIEREIKDRKGFLDLVEQKMLKLQETLSKKVDKPSVPGLNLQGPGGAPVAPVALPPANVPPLTPELPESVRRQMSQQLIAKYAILQQSVEDLPLSIRSQKDRVESINKQIQAQMHGPPSPESIAEAEKDPDVITLQHKEKMYRAKYNQYRSTYNNPDATVLQGYLDHANSLGKLAKEKRDKKIHELELAKRQSKADGLILKFEEEKRKLQESEMQLQLAQERLNRAKTEIAQLPPDMVKEKLTPAEKKEEEKKPIVNPSDTYLLAEDDIFRNTAHHAATLRLDIDSPKRVSISQPASTPVQKETKKQVIGTVFAALLGFALVGLGIFGYEMRSQKLCGLPDLKSSLRQPVVGVIPWTPDSSWQKDPIRRADVLESIDKLRSFVTQTWFARGATTIAVTSPLGDEGKAFTSYQLATSLAKGGYKTLLVDFDLRNPSLHREAEVPNELGVCELLRGEADFSQTMQRMSSGLCLLTAGQWTESPGQHAVGGRLEMLLNRLREPFDCVVLHTHSLLTAAESVEVARRCEVVLLCTQYRESRMPLLTRAADRIATMEIPYSGVVYLGATSEEALC